jgi:hypothetical protein
MIVNKRPFDDEDSFTIRHFIFLPAKAVTLTPPRLSNRHQRYNLPQRAMEMIANYASLVSFFGLCRKNI